MDLPGSSHGAFGVSSLLGAGWGVRGQTGAGEAARLKTGSGTLAEKAGRGRPAVGGISRRLERPPRPRPPSSRTVCDQAERSSCKLPPIYLWFVAIARYVHPEKNKQGVKKLRFFSWKSEPVRGPRGQHEPRGALGCSRLLCGQRGRVQAFPGLRVSRGRRWWVRSGARVEWGVRPSSELGGPC